MAYRSANRCKETHHKPKTTMACGSANRCIAFIIVNKPVGPESYDAWK